MFAMGPIGIGVGVFIGFTLLAMIVANAFSSSTIGMILLFIGCIAAIFFAISAYQSKKIKKERCLQTKIEEIEKEFPSALNAKRYDYAFMGLKGFMTRTLLYSVVLVPSAEALKTSEPYLWYLFSYDEHNLYSRKKLVDYSKIIQCDIVVSGSVINTVTLYSAIAPVSTSVSTSSNDVYVRFIDRAGNVISIPCYQWAADAVFASYQAYVKMVSEFEKESPKMEEICEPSTIKQTMIDASDAVEIANDEQHVSERLRKLKMIFEEGLISREEFDKKRNEIISEL